MAGEGNLVFCLNVIMSDEVDPQIRLHQILYKRRCAAWAFHFYSTRLGPLGVGRKLVGQQKVFTLEDYFILFYLKFCSFLNVYIFVLSISNCLTLLEGYANK